MILDAQSILSNNQAITATAVSTNVYDTAGVGVNNPVANIFGLATQNANPSFGEDLGGGGPGASSPQLGVWIPTTFTAAGAATLTIQLQCAVDTNNTGAPGTWQTIDVSPTFALADLIAAQIPQRALISWAVPERYPGQGFPRFYRLNYVVATGPMTAGNIFAALLTGIDSIQMYPANY
jgi:hypothetical protein